MNRRSLLTSFGIGLLGTATAGCVGLRDQRSANEGLDPESDVDGDGFTVCEEQTLLPAAEVGRIDIFVEVDWTSGNRPDESALNRLIDVYDAAPVHAVHGADDGINLHIEYGEEVPSISGQALPDDLRRYRETYFENEGRGYH